MPYYIPQSDGSYKEVAYDSFAAAYCPDVEYWEKSPFEEDDEEPEAPDEENSEEI